MLLLIIARNEFLNHFRTPFGWIILAVVQFLCGYRFVARIALYVFDLEPKLSQLSDPPGVSQLIGINLLAWFTELMLIIVPLVTMKTISEERRLATFELLLSAPVSRTTLVLGKYVGTMGFVVLITLLQFFMLISLELSVTLDRGLLFSAFIGLVLMLAAIVAIGIFFSSLVRHPAVAALGSAASLLFIWNMDWSAVSEFNYRGFSGFLAMPSHLHSMLGGDLVVSDMLYFLVVSGLFLVLTIRRIDSERLIE